MRSITQSKTSNEIMLRVWKKVSIYIFRKVLRYVSCVKSSLFQRNVSITITIHVTRRKSFAVSNVKTLHLPAQAKWAPRSRNNTGNMLVFSCKTFLLWNRFAPEKWLDEFRPDVSASQKRKSKQTFSFRVWAELFCSTQDKYEDRYSCSLCSESPI